CDVVVSGGGATREEPSPLQTLEEQEHCCRRGRDMQMTAMHDRSQRETLERARFTVAVDKAEGTATAVRTVEKVASAAALLPLASHKKSRTEEVKNIDSFESNSLPPTASPVTVSGLFLITLCLNHSG
ncbi:hypothetical protein SDJN02_03867, partial [Cucurbita argyrosperma subsp. argyrosperma]